MQLILVLCAILIVIEDVRAVDYYADIYDDVDVDAILRSNRLTEQYVKCLLDKGPCTADARQLKRILPEALETRCARCSQRQLQVVKRITAHVKAKRPDDWKLFLRKYGPSGDDIEIFEHFLNRH